MHGRAKFPVTVPTMGTTNENLNKNPASESMKKERRNLEKQKASQVRVLLSLGIHCGSEKRQAWAHIALQMLISGNTV